MLLSFDGLFSIAIMQVYTRDKQKVLRYSTVLGSDFGGTLAQPLWNQRPQSPSHRRASSLPSVIAA